MIDTFLGARLIDLYTIKVCIFSNYIKPVDSPILLLINEDYYEDLLIIKQSYLNGLVICECRTTNPITLGNSYSVVIKDIGTAPLILEDLLNLPSFDKDYFYDKDDLGFTYKKNQTTFKLWAPLASKVYLLIRKNKGDNFDTYPLKREEKGVHSILLKGDYEGYKYRYRIVNNGISTLSIDPYGRASTANGKDSVVIDFEKTKIDLCNDIPPKLKQYSDAIIYELNVRDFTIQNSTNIKYKGKFLGLIEEGKKTKKGNPCGLDYLKMLGITHVQLQPVNDFTTVDELNIDGSYNWGYDPSQYFVPEGSYSTDPEDPYKRIIEFKKMVAKLHQNKIKVILDVVYNHVYNDISSTLERAVPGYYFRKNEDGTLCNGSFCGNDLDTKRPMVRKLIVDACKYWVKEYGIDGYRFDLMGNIDLETMQIVEKECRAIRDDFIIYGEGWDMDTALRKDEKATIQNSSKVPHIGFFNETFRDIVRSFNHGNDAGYMLGNLAYRDGFKYVFMGACVDFIYKPRFINANQSINYVECHDNRTLYDRINACKVFENKKEDILETIKTINTIIALSFGISYYHAGQEIGLTKYGEDNTYNLGDKYNQFDWNVLDERISLAKYFSDILKLKKEIFKNNATSASIIGLNTYFINLENGGVLIKLKLNNEKIKNIIIGVNPSFKNINVKFDKEVIEIVSKDKINLKNSKSSKKTTLSPHELKVFINKE